METRVERALRIVLTVAKSPAGVVALAAIGLGFLGAVAFPDSSSAAAVASLAFLALGAFVLVTLVLSELRSDGSGRGAGPRI